MQSMTHTADASHGRSAVPIVARALALAAILAAAILAASEPSAIEALKAAGVTGKMPAGAEAFKTLIDTLADNVLWIVSTVVGIAVLIGGLLMMLGHTRAPDILIKIGGGIVVMLVVAPGVAA